MRITCLAENTAMDNRFGAEHGLSLYIETGAHAVVFDMGQTGLFAENARKLGIDLRDADTAVLSHGHYDHGGGLKRFLEINRSAPVYVSRHAFAPHYNGTGRYNGLDASLREHDRLIYTGDETVIGAGLTLYTCNGRARGCDLGSFGMSEERNGIRLPDDFRHEQYLLIEEAGKRTLVSGCSHKGIMNIMEWMRPDVLVGGFHFSTLPLDETLAAYARRLNGFSADYYTCHCTGADQFAFMQGYMHRLFYLSTGQSIDI